MERGKGGGAVARTEAACGEEVIHVTVPFLRSADV
jgi:hypothetical protein